MIKDFSQLVVKEVEAFKNKGGEIGVIEYHLEQIRKQNYKYFEKDDIKEIEKLMNYLELKKSSL